MSKKILEFKEMFKLVNQGLSYIEYFSDENDGWETDLSEERSNF